MFYTVDYYSKNEKKSWNSGHVWSAAKLHLAHLWGKWACHENGAKSYKVRLLAE